MKRLAPIIVVAFIITTSAQGQESANAYTSPLEIQINGSSADGQIFMVGETITITCRIVANASHTGAPYNRAQVQSSLLLYKGGFIPKRADIYPWDEDISSAIVDVDTVFTFTYTPVTPTTYSGEYRITANSNAYASRRDTIGESWELIAFDSVSNQLNFEVVDVIPVGIDIKPGSTPNTINLGSNGVVPVAILSSDTFDATQVDPATVALAGAGVALRGKGTNYLTIEKDVNGDGFIDLEVKVETENLDPGTFQDGSAVLTGNLLPDFGGTPIEGSDTITIVPPE